MFVQSDNGFRLKTSDDCCQVAAGRNAAMMIKRTLATFAVTTAAVAGGMLFTAPAHAGIELGLSTIVVTGINVDLIGNFEFIADAQLLQQIGLRG